MTVGQEFKAFAVLLEEEVRNLKRTAELLLEVNLGATAIGTGLNTPKGYTELVVKHLAEVTGLPCVPAENLIEATSDCGAYVMVHGALKRTCSKNYLKYVTTYVYSLLVHVQVLKKLTYLNYKQVLLSCLQKLILLFQKW